jgi:hypothetical protein
MFQIRTISAFNHNISKDAKHIKILTSAINAPPVILLFYLDYQLNTGRCDVLTGVNNKPLIGCLTLATNGNCVNCANGFKLNSVGKCDVGI